MVGRDHVQTGWRARLAGLYVGSLRWALGIFAVLIGVLMLIVPHQFGSIAFLALQPLLPWAGLIFVAVGAALMATAALQPPLPLVVAAHLAASAALLFLVAIFVRSQTSAALPFYSVLSLCVLLAVLLPDARGQGMPEPRRRGDLFALAIGLATAATGLLMLAIPAQFRSQIYDLVRPSLRSYGLAFTACGLLLAFAQLQLSLDSGLRRLTHLLVGACLLLWSIQVSIPFRTWTNVAAYAGFGLTIAALPWLERHLRSFDPSSLRVRTALAFMGIATLPLILTTALMTERQERIARQQALVYVRQVAHTARDLVEDFVRLHQAGIEFAAAQPGLLAASPREQESLLRRMVVSYPELYACSLFDAEGNGLARSDGQPDQRVAGLPVFEDARRTNASAIEVRASSRIGRPVVVFGAPIRDAEGRFAGLLGCGLETSRLSRLLSELSRPLGQTVYIVDARGCLIAHPDPRLPLCDSAISARPPAVALRDGSPTGVLQFGSADAQLASYVRVPDLGWGLVVEHQASAALVGVHAAREIAFGTLALVSALALVAGLATAFVLTRSLRTLSRAVRRLAAGDSSAPLPQHGVKEVRQLADSFDDLRQQLDASHAANVRAIAALQESEARYREQYEEAQAAVQTRDVFVSIASHELKTPLTSLLGYVDLLRRRAGRANNLSERDLRSIELVRSQADRLNKLIGGLLDLSRIETGQLSIDREPVDLVALTQAVVDEVRPTLDQHTISLRLPELPLVVEGDALRLEQVLRNLLQNAIKYSPMGGEVCVELLAQAQQARLVVRDQGIGIPASALPQLFSRFYRAPNADVRAFSGMGLGLFVVREIVGLHGGEVSVESQEGQGSAFAVVLPLLASADYASPSATNASR
jgi:signal transduction histidine kinase